MGQSDSSASRSMVRWTRILGFFTAILAIVAGAQWYLMYKANENTKDIFVRTQRPVLGIASEGAYYYGWETSPTSPTAYRVGYYLQNSGSTSAVDTRAVVVVCETPCSGDKAQPYPSKLVAAAGSDIVGARSNYNIWTDIPLSEVLAASGGRKQIYVILYAEYGDVFTHSRKYHLTMCYQLVVTPDRDLLKHPPKDYDYSLLFSPYSCAANNTSD
ncbi:MAG: hypothetical protein KGJ78_09925 [Alphaproteobacteria bacterium]|nr:hypothetical protein [Alphaproteobacteria bacterium]